MNFQQQLQQSIMGIFSQNNTIRRQSEEFLSQLREAQPNEFVISMLQLCECDELKVKQFAPVYLRNSLSKFAPKSHKNVWQNLNVETQEFVKNRLFQLLEQENSHIVRNQLCDTIGEIGGSLKNNEWPNLLQTLWQLFLSPKNEMIESGFKILSNLFVYIIDQFDNYINDLHTLFTQGLASQQMKIKTATIQALGNYVKNSTSKQYKQFQDLINNMMQSAYFITLQEQQLGEDTMEVFSDIVDQEPKFFKKQFKVFFNGIFTIFREQIIDNGIKRIGTETLLSMVEKYPRLFQQDKLYLIQLVEMIFFHMIQISPIISDEWIKPAEGFNDDVEQDEDCETTRFGTSSIDRLIETLGQRLMIPILNPIINQLLQHEDWRYQHAAIMALSQIGEYMNTIIEIQPVVELILPKLNDQNPMIRYSVCHAIGQIADDMKPKFQETYLHSIIPEFLNRLNIEEVPRVNSHILAALTNFVEGTEKGIEKYALQLIQQSIRFLRKGISIEKENAMSVIAATAESSKQNFITFLQQIMPLLFEVFQIHQTKQYRQLKGQTIEAITLIASSVGGQQFQPYLEQTVKILIQVQTSQLDSIDPQKSYVLSGWQRLAMICPQYLSKYLEEIVPSLFRLIQIVFSIQGEDNNNEELHTYDNEEAEVAIHMLSVFIEELKQSFFPYVEQCIKLIIPLCNFKTDENIRRASCKCLVSLVKNVKETNNFDQLVNGSKYFLGVVLEAATIEDDPIVIIEQIDCIKNIIDTVQKPFMNTEEVTELANKIFKLLLDSYQRKAVHEALNQIQNNDEEIDEDEKNNIKKDTQTEEKLNIKIAECIGYIFKTHKQYVIPLSENICNQILPKVLDKTQSSKQHYFGLCLIDYMIEYLGYPFIQQKMMDFAQVLIIFAQDKECFVRQVAIYGIGILAVNTPKELYCQISQQLLKAIVESLKIQINENENEKQYGLAKDNSIAALGKIINTHPESLGQDYNQGLETWLYLLPIKYDYQQAQIQHQYLADFIVQDCDKIINYKEENVFQILKIFANCYKTKRSNKLLDKKIQSSLKILEQNRQVDIIKQFARLTQEEQKNLNSF